MGKGNKTYRGEEEDGRLVAAETWHILQGISGHLVTGATGSTQPWGCCHWEALRFVNQWVLEQGQENVSALSRRTSATHQHCALFS